MVEVVERATVFTTKDGREFTDQQEAEKHEQILTARDNFQTAEYVYGSLLAQGFRTADGQPFDPRRWNYYYVRFHGGSRPTVEEITLYRYCSDTQRTTHCWHYDIYAPGDPRLCIALQDKDRSYTIAISDIYSTRHAAEVARNERWEQYIAWEQEDLRKNQALRR